MPYTKVSKTTLIAALLIALLVAGCASKEVLVRKSPVAPAESVLSGQWTMIEDIDTMQRQIDRAIQLTSGAKPRRKPQRAVSSRNGQQQSAQGSNRAGSRKVGGLVYVFLENGKALKITQTESGLFIDFDRSVVEEYRFGEARMITKGEVEAQRVSGWENQDYLVETLDSGGMKLTESYQLQSDNLLLREIILRSKKGQSVTIIQNFERNAG